VSVKTVASRELRYRERHCSPEKRTEKSRSGSQARRAVAVENSSQQSPHANGHGEIERPPIEALQELAPTRGSCKCHHGQDRSTTRSDFDPVARKEQRSDEDSFRQAMEDERDDQDRCRSSRLQPLRHRQRSSIEQGMKSQQAHDHTRMDPLVFRRMLDQPECPVTHGDETKSHDAELIPQVRQYVDGNESWHDTDDESVDGETQDGPISARDHQSESCRQGKHAQHQSHGGFAAQDPPAGAGYCRSIKQSPCELRWP
jgi:hypothetical protein